MAAYNESLLMNRHAADAIGFGDDTPEISGTQRSFRRENMYSDERSPLLICTPTRDYTTKKSSQSGRSSVLFVNKAALYEIQKPKISLR